MRGRKPKPWFRKQPQPRCVVVEGLFEFMEVFDNRVRRHSTLAYVSPVECERTHNPELR